MARRPSSVTLADTAWVITLRLGRDRLGVRKALAALQRSPFLCVTWYWKAPACSAPL
ncbi:MAG: hypothetical protein V9E98_08325 [Candidatus Nanopelagicales bacterium]